MPSLPRLLGRTEPRIFTEPLRELTPETSFGFEAIESARLAGRVLYPWQEWFLIHSLELALGSFTHDEFPQLRFKTVLLLVARQNGKSFIMSTRLLWRMLMWTGPEVEPPLILGAAHKLSAAEEILDLSVKALNRGAGRRYIAHRSNVNGNKYFELTNGARYKCEAASDDGGRGLSVTDLAFDELRQQRDWAAWSALTNTTNARFSSQTIAVSNAGTARADVLRGLRKQALDRIAEFEAMVNGGALSPEEYAGSHDTTLALFEWSAPDNCDINDRDGWAYANPSLNHPDEKGVVYLPEEMLASKAAMVGKHGEDGVPEHVFRTENLCQWVTVEIASVFDTGVWAAGTDELSEIAPDSPLFFGVDVSHNRQMSYVAVAGFRADGLPHVEVIAQRAGNEWVPAWLQTAVEEHKPVGVVIQGRGAPVSSLYDSLVAVDVPVIKCEGTDLGAAHGRFYDSVVSGKVRHLPQPSLDVAADEGLLRPLGDVSVWDRVKSPVDVSPLIACAKALWGLEVAEIRGSKTRISFYETSGVVAV